MRFSTYCRVLVNFALLWEGPRKRKIRIVVNLTWYGRRKLNPPETITVLRIMTMCFSKLGQLNLV